MKRVFLLIYNLLLSSYILFCQNDSLIPNFNNTFYPSVLSAAKGVAKPFLVDQAYFSIAGANPVDSTINYAGSHYRVHNYYLNPTTNYYILSSQYGSYDISSFNTVWPNECPNIFYKSSDTSFNAQSDCVGYLTRLLSVTGNTTAVNNAYLNIINTVHAGNTSHFAALGYVSTAYSFAVAFPTLASNVSNGWQYVAGNVESSAINTYNHTIQSSLAAYNGVRKGGLAQSLPGDILAFGYSASSSSNGHVMVMETSPQLLTADSLPGYFPSQTLAQANTLLNKYHLYSMPVFDCSGKQAHFRDSRKITSGIGHGKLILLSDLNDDAPVGFIFDSTQVTGSNLHFDTLGTSVYAVSVGRFVSGSVSSIESLVYNQAHYLIYPNPNAGELTIDCLSPSENSTLQMRDLVGNLVKQVTFNSKQFTLNTGDLSVGVYTLSIINESGTCTQKIIISR